MARTFNGTTDRIDYSNPWNPQGSAITISAWIYHTDLSNEGYVSHIHTAGDAGAGIGFRAEGGAGGLSFFRVGSSLKARRTDNAQYSADEWVHILVTDPNLDFGDGTEIAIYINGTEASGYDTTGNGVSESSFGGSHSLGGRIYDDNRNFAGRIAEVAHWNRVLTAGEIAALAAGLSPASIGNGLQTYIAEIRESLCLITGAVGSADGTTVGDHPPVQYIGYNITYIHIPASGDGGGVPVIVRVPRHVVILRRQGLGGPIA